MPASVRKKVRRPHLSSGGAGGAGGCGACNATTTTMVGVFSFLRCERPFGAPAIGTILARRRLNLASVLFKRECLEGDVGDCASAVLQPGPDAFRSEELFDLKVSVVCQHVGVGSPIPLVKQGLAAEASERRLHHDNLAVLLERHELRHTCSEMGFVEEHRGQVRELNRMECDALVLLECLRHRALCATIL